MNPTNKRKNFVILAVVLMALSLAGCTESKRPQEADLAVIQQKIIAGEIKQLTIKQVEIVAIDREEIEYHTPVVNDFFKANIIKQASEIGENGKRKVERIDVLSEDNNRFFGVFVFWIIPLVLIISVGVTGFILGRASKSLR